MMDPEQIRKKRAKEEALARLSRKCPVIKQANNILEDSKPLDSMHAIDLLIIGLDHMGEAKASIELLQKVKSYGE